MRHLSQKILDHVVNLILAYKKPEKIVLFGSQASQSAGKTSDIDIAIWAKDWSDRDFNIVKDRLEEGIKTPLKFDVINYYGLSKETLRKSILEKGEVIYGS